MSRSPRNRRTGVAISVVIGAMALAGCGAGQITQTNTQVAGVNGAQATIGEIAIRDAAFTYEKSENASIYTRGEDAPLQMRIVNSSGTDDRLVSASSPVARSVRISGEAVVVAGRTLLVEGAPAAEAAPASGSATATPTPTPTPAPTPAPTSAAAAPGAEAEGAQVVLVGVNQEIRPGLTYPVTLTFEKAGAVTVQVPVANPEEPREESAPE